MFEMNLMIACGAGLFFIGGIVGYIIGRAEGNPVIHLEPTETGVQPERPWERV